jgi:hypothetical protein
MKTYARRENTVSRACIKYIDSVNNNCPKKRTIGLGCLQGLVCITFKEEMTQILHTICQEIEA